MQFTVTLNYKDEKSLRVKIKKGEIAKFFEDLTSCQVYVHPDTRMGFWTNLSDIRYITTVIEKGGEGGIEVIQRTEEVAKKLSNKDERMGKGGENGIKIINRTEPSHAELQKRDARVEKSEKNS